MTALSDSEGVNFRTFIVLEWWFIIDPQVSECIQITYNINYYNVTNCPDIIRILYDKSRNTDKINIYNKDKYIQRR